MSSSPRKHPITDSNPDSRKNYFFLGTVVLFLFIFTLISCGATQTAPSDPRGTIRFKCSESEARLIVNEIFLGPCALFEETGILLSPGKHRIVVQKADFFTEYLLLEVEEDQIYSLEIELTQIP